MSPAAAPPLPAQAVPRTGERRRPSPREAGTTPVPAATVAPATPIALGGRGPTAAAPATAEQAPAAVPAYLGGDRVAGGAELGAAAGPPLPAMAGPDLLMPEPPEGLSAEERERIHQAEQQTGAVAAATSAMPAAEDNVAGARAAVEEPEAETNARAAASLAEALGERAAPSPEIEALCERIQEAIRRRRPPDEDSLLAFDPGEATQAAGDELNASVQGQSEQVQGTYDQLQEEPSGEPAQEAQSLEPPPERVETPEVNAEAAVPDAVPAEDVSLDADVAASEARISEAGMTTAPAELITDPDNPVSQAREGQAGLTEAAARDPQEVLAEQTAAREQARGAMQGLQASTLAALEASRAATAGAVGGDMVAMGGSEVQMRTRASAAAQTIFNEARDQVRALLEPLPRTALERWQSGISVLSTQVEQESERFNTWKRERYAGISGTALQVVELFAGLPDWAIAWLNSIEQNFGRRVCNLLREISVEVNTVIATCEEIISNANTRIAAVFAALPESLQQWAAGEQANFSSQLEGLREEAHSTRADFNRQISQEASQAVQSVRERIHAMREEAQGLFGQIANAIERFAEDPAKFIIEGLLKIVGIAPSAFWALVDRIGQVIDDIADDPVNFADNLALALKQGFQHFFDNFGTHILGGFFDWLFSGLGSVGVEIPSDFSLGSLITFFLQLMGITWARIRQILARHIGEENVALLERAYELIALLMEQGVDGIFELIKEQLNPQTLLDAIISAAVDLLIDMLIRAVTPQVILMFNPAGIIIQAIRVIYNILAWVFNNAARIFSLVETVVNGAADLIAGNIGGMATAVEGALARLIAPVIDFLAGLLHLGNLPDQIARAIGGFQDMVLAAIERVVAVIAQRARALLRTLMAGGDGGPDERTSDEKERDLDGAIGRAEEALDSEDRPDQVQDDLPALRQRYRLTVLELRRRDSGAYYVYGEVNPHRETKDKTFTIGGLQMTGEEIMQMIRRVAEDLYESEEARNAQATIAATQTDVDLPKRRRPQRETTLPETGSAQVGRVRQERENMASDPLTRGQVATSRIGTNVDQTPLAVSAQQAIFAAPGMAPRAREVGTYLPDPQRPEEVALSAQLQEIQDRFNNLGEDDPAADSAAVPLIIQSFMLTRRMPRFVTPEEGIVLARAADLIFSSEGQRSPASLVTSAMLLDVMASEQDPRRTSSGAERPGPALNMEEQLGRLPMQPQRAESASDQLNRDLGFPQFARPAARARADYDELDDRSRSAYREMEAREVQLAQDWVEALVRETVLDEGQDYSEFAFGSRGELESFIREHVRRFYRMND